MLTLLRLIIFRNSRALLTLFFVTLFSSVGFITLEQLTTNIESSVASETRPLFGADMVISPEGYTGASLIDIFAPYLTGETYIWAERHTFSTTLFDREGKTALVKIVSYRGAYPQRGILKTEKINTGWEDSCHSDGERICPEDEKVGQKKINQTPLPPLSGGLMEQTEQARFLPTQKWQEQLEQASLSPSFSVGQVEWVAATPWLIDRFASWWIISLDERKVSITEKILKSSDLAFSLGTENHLIILPESLLSGSQLLSSGSRLDYDLLISFSDESRARILDKKWESIPALKWYRIRNYEERSERNLETARNLTDYILLILVVSSIFALVILRSSHDGFFDSLSRTLRIVEILGFSRKRQILLFSLLYIFLIPTTYILSGYIASLILIRIATFPEAESFHWFFSAFFESLFLLSLLIFAAFFPAWRAKFADSVGIENQRKKSRFWRSLNFRCCEARNNPVLEKKSSLHPSLFKKPILQSSFIQKIPAFFSRFIDSTTLVNFSIWLIVITIIFRDFLFALMVVVWGIMILWLLSVFLGFLYGFIFTRAKFLRERRFPLFDALRSLVRPLTPTLPITISLVSVTTFLLVFLLFSLAFRSELSLDVTQSANIYALNILESDRPKIEKILSGADMYSILRARIEKVNDRTLAGHLGDVRPSGEFTREFNITTTPLPNTILRWKDRISATEVSVDDEFANRLGVDIGDRITFLLSGREITLTVANVRASKRQGFRPFFYFSFDPLAFANAPKTYFVSTYTRDTESWKRLILANSGPHVTFIDVENILSIIRDISWKILSVIWLFFAVISVFALFAVISFFSRMREVESMKARLYTLFGASARDIRTSITGTRVTLFVVSYILSLIIWGILSYFVLSRGSFFHFSFSDFFMVAGLMGVVYGILGVVLRR